MAASPADWPAYYADPVLQSQYYPMAYDAYQTAYQQYYQYFAAIQNQPPGGSDGSADMLQPAATTAGTPQGRQSTVSAIVAAYVGGSPAVPFPMPPAPAARDENDAA
ncbi:hypothetical protein HK405_009942 [Cladochytrium tenue]|nr:hypothetical protein HK405_009942 [Cladochytrium tenue]